MLLDLVNYLCPECNKIHVFLKKDYSIVSKIENNEVYKIFVLSDCKKMVGLEFDNQEDLNNGTPTRVMGAKEAVKSSLTEYNEYGAFLSPELVEQLYEASGRDKKDIGEILSEADNNPGALDEFLVALGPVSLNFVKNNKEAAKKIQEKYCLNFENKKVFL